MKTDVLLGLQWGDEGKGKIVDVLTPDYSIIARFQGGPNAGHTLEFEGNKHVLHTIPSGIFRKSAINVIGNGVVIDPIVFVKELERLEPYGIDLKNQLLISKKAHLILPTHRMIDAASELSKGLNKIGSTLKGIGPTYMDKTGRNGLRVGDLLSERFNDKYRDLKDKHLSMLQYYPPLEMDLAAMEAEWFRAVDTIKKLTCIDSEHYLNKALADGKSILAEGAQGTMLDIDFGTYPFVTSSNTVSSGTCTGLGVPPSSIGKVIGIFKAYCTRVGSGPFPTELTDEVGEAIRQEGREFGSTTGRARRCGWLDLVQLKYAVMINGVTELYMMKADVLSIFDELFICEAYTIQGELVRDFPYDIHESDIVPVLTPLKGWKQDLTQLTQFEQAPDALKHYVSYIESSVGVPIRLVSVGPDRAQTLLK
jgi:adenylosuccinate synthase